VRCLTKCSQIGGAIGGKTMQLSSEPQMASDIFVASARAAAAYGAEFVADVEHYLRRSTCIHYLHRPGMQNKTYLSWSAS